MHKKFEYKQSAIHYNVYGDGVPVVLLHGFGEDSSIWEEQVKSMKFFCNLIVPDLPGTGRSELLKLDEVSLTDFAEMLYALVVAENISTCIMLGHSMGGYVTLAFADKYPAMLKGFGLIHSSAFADNEEKKASRKKGIEMIEQYGAYSFIKATIPNLFSAGFKRTHPEKVEALIEKGKSFTDVSLQQYYTAMMLRPDHTNVLKCSEIPVLFILGTDDVAAPLADVLQQVHLPSVSYIHILTGVGHMGMLEATEKVNNHLSDFIRSFESL